MTKKYTTVVQQIDAMLKLFKNGKGWTTDALARDKRGFSTTITDPSACYYCLIGGIGRVTDNEYVSSSSAARRINLGQVISSAIQMFTRENSRSVYIPGFNDTRKTYEDVKEVLLIAREIAKGARLAA
jgi:hypothetical protein